MGAFVFPTGGGGVDLTALALTVLDMGLAGGSETDPDSIMDTVATASDITTFTMNAISSGSNDYSFSSGTNLRPYRKHWALVDDDGTAVLGGDRCLIVLEIDNSTSFTGDGPMQVFLGIASTPASTTTSSAELCGICEEHLDNATTPRYLAMAGTGGGTVLQNANNEKASCGLLLAGNKVTDATVIAEGNGESYGPSERNYGSTFADDAPLSLVAGCGSRSSGVIAAGDEWTGIFRYRVIRF